MPRANTKRRYLFLGLILILLIVLHYTHALNSVEVGIRSVITPVSTAINNWRVSLAGKYDPSDSKQSILQEYNQCVQKNQDTQVDQANLKLLQADNSELKNQLNFVQGKKYSPVTTQVVGKNMDSIEKMVMIDAGESSGIKLDQPVIAGNGILVGTIAKVDKDVSMVRLLNDNQSKIAATILNKDGSLGVVEGGYGLSVRINFIPRDEVILVGDQIVTSGLDQNIPRGLLIAEVAVAENEAYQPFQQAVLTTAADLTKLTFVTVLTSF